MRAKCPAERNEANRATTDGDFHKLLTMVGDDEWTKPTEGTRWTNEQLLFHVVFGYLVVQRLLVLVRVLSHLPDWVMRSTFTEPTRLLSFTTATAWAQKWTE